MFDFLSQWHWSFSGIYAVRHTGTWGKNLKKIYLHRFIMNTPEGMDTDHINGDKLDNQKSNLRICSHGENMRNQIIRANNTSGYKGVSLMKNGKYQVHIWKNGQQYFLGNFEDIEQAKEKYNKAAREYHKEYASPNH